MTGTPFITRSQDDIAIAGMAWESDPENTKTAFLLHGFSSSQKNSTNEAMIPTLLAQGYRAIAFDFRGCGASEGDIGTTTISNGLTDFEAVISYAQANYPDVFSGAVLLVGSSFGGAVAIAATRRYKVSRLLLKSPMTNIYQAQFAVRGEAAMRQWEESGYLRMERRSGVVNLSYEYIDDSQKYNFLDPIYCDERIATFIAHGDEDEIAPIKFSQDFVSCCPQLRKLHVIKGANHKYSNPIHFSEMIDYLSKFTNDIDH